MQAQQERRKLTTEEATSFDRISPMHIAILTEAAQARGCTCRPYADWYTYGRWAAQGMQVQRGEHGVRLTVFLHVEPTTDDDGKQHGGHSYPHGTTVFCRCQVKAREERKAA